jgi:choline dehydrogenase
MHAAQSFNYIVVGGGSAGCIVANRLSKNPAVRVCLIEAGPSDRKFPTRLKVDTPIGNTTLLPHDKYNWKHSFTGGANLLDRIIPAPRGRILGGTSAVNGMIYIRGHRSDYDGWRDLGNPGWGYDDVLPFFRTHENHEAGADEFHGSGGEMNVAPLRQLNPLCRAFVEAAAETQLRRNDDFNGVEQEGVGAYEVTQKNGERWTSARAFLPPAVTARSNLQIVTDALVTELRFDGNRAVGVTLRQGGATVSFDVTGEIVLCGGTINSPQLLMLSGVGPVAALAAHGIAVRRDLPGVGQNLQDHPTVNLVMTDPGRHSYALTPRSALPLALSVLQYALFRRGRLTSNAVETGGFVRTLPDLKQPDLQFILMPALKEMNRTIPRAHGFYLLSVLLRPQSRGEVALVSNDPAVRPKLIPNFLDADADLDCLTRGIRLGRKILAAPAFVAYRGEELLPGAAALSDQALRDYVRGAVYTSYHPVGTCKMGPSTDPLAVVDRTLRVRGVDGLRVVDASIMPVIVSGNTNAPAMMIGERGAAFIHARTPANE